MSTERETVGINEIRIKKKKEGLPIENAGPGGHQRTATNRGEIQIGSQADRDREGQGKVDIQVALRQPYFRLCKSK